MVKFTLAILATTIAVAAVSTAAQAAPLARVGVGQVYKNVADCAANSATYTPSEAAMAYARVHPSKGTPVYGANATGTVCVLMHTSVPGKAEDGLQQGDHWVRVPKKYVYQAQSGGMIYYTLCNNPISQVEEQVAVRTEEAPCTDCAAPSKQQNTVTYTTEQNTVTYQPETRRVSYQGAPVSFNLPGQSIGQGLFPQAISASVFNQTSNTNHFNFPTQPTTPTRPVVDTIPPGGVRPVVDTIPPLPNPIPGLPNPGNGGNGLPNPQPGTGRPNLDTMGSVSGNPGLSDPFSLGNNGLGGPQVGAGGQFGSSGQQQIIWQGAGSSGDLFNRVPQNNANGSSGFNFNSTTTTNTFTTVNGVGLGNPVPQNGQNGNGTPVLGTNQ